MRNTACKHTERVDFLSLLEFVLHVSLGGEIVHDTRVQALGANDDFADAQTNRY